MTKTADILVDLPRGFSEASSITSHSTHDNESRMYGIYINLF
jgi:hypothetical protein